MATTDFTDGITLSAAAWFNDADALIYEGASSFATTATAAGTTTLVLGSAMVQEFTGATTQTVVLPVTSTLTTSWKRHIINNSTGALTINSSGGNLVQTLYAGQRATISCILASGTTAASWAVSPKREYVESVVGPVAAPTSGEYGDVTSISLTAGDWDVTAVANTDADGATVTAAYLGISTTTGNSATGLTDGSNYIGLVTPDANTHGGGSVASYRLQLTSTTTVYMKARSIYTVATPKYYGRLSARRT